MQKEPLNPGGHGLVGCGGSVVHVDDEHGDDDGQGDEDHDEQQVLPDERDDLGGRRDDLLDHQEEDRQGNQDRGGQGELLALVGRQVEDQHGQEGQPQAGDDEEERVEQGQAAQHEGVADERVPAGAGPPAPGRAPGVHDLPLSVVEEVLPVHVLVCEDELHHGPVVSPGPELHGAVLPVEREEGDVHGAGALVAGGRRPPHGAVPSDDSLGHERAFEAAVRTVESRPARPLV